MAHRAFFALALAAAAIGSAQAHQLWIERAAPGTARVYVGDVDGERDRGDEVAKLGASTRLFAADAAAPLPLAVREDHLLAASVPADADLRLINDQVWKPWRGKDGVLKAAVFNAREGRRDTRAVLDYEFVPEQAGASRFRLVFKGQPAASRAVTVVDPAGWSRRLQTDADGWLTVPDRGAGRYVLIAAHTDRHPQDVAGTRVDAVDYTATLSYVAR
ncbi:nickel uptake transporter family protein [uncultured Pseudacidovorax sp.]|uniref:nickel uptake transporter family protein n=1 Tax=uncultured Pseudacidovorax sp. TaxID=679313 RepID=UPI0025CD3D7A|nr:nickel uptake transporter family protein [uncultured Pseudacidovorax sp.]